ncbi:MAG: diguanylate cyclase/phosphodiesterase & domain with sensor(s) [Ilumatobacteraceae bacterium]|nr:diguanylate cyclase/phosphodiesterase & domain with sensor(s) [Ilumatobacteraceae bacterium]
MTEVPAHRLRQRVQAHIVDLYVAAVVLANLIVCLAVARVESRIDHHSVNWLAFAIFAVLLVVAETKPSFSLRFGEGGEITPGWAFAFALVLLGSPLLAVLCSAVATLIADLIGRKAFLKVLFNVSQVSMSLGLGALVLNLSGLSGPALSRHDISFVQSLGMVCAGATVLITSALLLFLVMALVRGVSVRVPIREGWMTSITADGALLAVAPIFVIAVDYSLLLLPMLAVTSFIVFTSARQAVRQAHAANHDPLTQLRNRAGFQHAIQLRLVDLVTALEVAATDPTAAAPDGLVLLLIDLDGFKEVNDRLGHATGDALLTAFAMRMERIIPPNAIAARLGGDEFSVLLDCTGTVEHELMLVHEMRHRLSQTLHVNGFPLTVGMSIGVACAPLHAKTAEELLGYADIAMYRAKRCRTGVELYGAVGEGREHGRISLLGALADAINEDQLNLAYHPQLRTATGECDMVEALLRWVHPTLGPVPPGDFIAVAEHTDLIAPITQFALERAIRDISALGDERVSVAVNISARNLQDRHFPESVLEIVRRYDLAPHRLELEITESALASDPERTRFAIDALRAEGIRIAIDDFGTGYSSFSSLRELEVDRIKIDKGFITRITTGTKDEILVRSIIRLASELGLETVAEGIEDLATWNLVRALGCDVGQGFVIAEPLTFPGLQRWLARRTGHQELSDFERSTMVGEATRA